MLQNRLYTEPIFNFFDACHVIFLHIVEQVYECISGGWISKIGKKKREKFAMSVSSILARPNYKFQ